MKAISRLFSYASANGVRYTVRRAGQKAAESLGRSWDRTWQSLRPDAETLQRQRDSQPAGGLISVLVPVYRTEPDFIDALAKSLTAQTYLNWEACLYVTGDRDETEKALQRAMDLDRRIRALHGEKNEGISVNTNHALEMARGEWIAFCDHDDLLPPDALWMLAEEIALGDADVIYTDEDRINARGRIHSEPHLKPDFCPDTLRSANYICHLMAARRSLIDEVGGLRPEADGSQDHDLALRLSEKTDRIRHVAVIGYHWRDVKTSASRTDPARCLERAAHAVERHMARIGWPGTAEPVNGVLRLRYQLRELEAVAFVVAPDSRAARACVKALRNALPENVPVRMALGENRFEAMNRAAARTDAPLMLFVDASVRGFSKDFFGELAMYAQRPDVGMVTPMLTDGSGRVTHAGFAVGTEGGLKCRNQGLPARAGGRFMMNRISHNVGAVSPACLMIRRSAWISLDTAYHTAFATADACMALREKGLVHVFTPHAKAVCEEPEACLLLTGDRDPDDRIRFNQRWGPVRDACWNPGLRLDVADFSAGRKEK